MTSVQLAEMRMAQQSKFWDRMAERYSRKPVPDEAAYRQKLQVTREYFRPDMEVLEFGCGTGSTAIAHAPYVKHIRAIDISSKMIEIAQRKADAGDTENVKFEQATLSDLDVPDEAFDAIMGHSILHLLEDKEAAVAKIYRLLKAGGIFVSNTPCIGDFLKAFKFIAPIGEFFRVFPLIRVFTRKELEDTLTAAGFELDHQWQPSKNKAVFIVAKKTGQPGSGSALPLNGR